MSKRRKEPRRIWMEGEIIANYPVGVRVYDLGYCTARCGWNKPKKCPDSEACRRCEVYVYRFNWGGEGEWCKRGGIYTREEALKSGKDSAEFEDGRAAKDPTLREYQERACKEGRI